MNSFYNGADSKGAKDSQGKTVHYTFNVKDQADFQKDGLSKAQIEKQYRQIAADNGIVGVQTQFGKSQDLNAPAAVITNEGSSAAFGSTLVNIIRLNANGPEGTVSHEVLHSLGLDDNGYMSGGLLNSPPQQIISSEVQETIQYSYDKKPER